MPGAQTAQQSGAVALFDHAARQFLACDAKCALPPTSQAIKKLLFSPGPVAAALIVGGVVMMVVDRWQAKRPAKITELKEIDIKTGFIIGGRRKYGKIETTDVPQRIE